MLYIPNVSMPTENHNYPYFPNPYNPFSKPEPVHFLTLNQPQKQFVPTMTGTMQAFQQHPKPLMNVYFPAINNAISVTQIV
ncbi:unnamed protein product [Onchocerca flexuosa]|uniref:Group-specific protein n=1 Tax=Onchocerca flexuosa TaxID=387005 RepID=A0A183HZR0_9BILA|nr:unnamed protein product [Onchocerca flexuosa]